MATDNITKYTVSDGTDVGDTYDACVQRVEISTKKKKTIIFRDERREGRFGG